MTEGSASDARDADLARRRRAAAFATIGTLALFVPIVADRLDPPLATVAAAGPFVLVAALALYAVNEGPLFGLFARPTDRRHGRLYGLAGFSLSIAVLALFATRFGMPTGAFVGSVLLLSFGNLSQQAVARHRARPIHASGGGPAGVQASPARQDPGGPATLTGLERAVQDPAAPVVAFAVGGAMAGLVGVGVTTVLSGEQWTLARTVFLVSTGVLLAGLVRSVVFERDDPLVLLSVGLVLWLFATLWTAPPPTRVGLGLALAVGFGALAYGIRAASVTGMLAGIFLSLLAVILGGYGWFAVLVTFFGLGGLISKYRYEEKLARGLAQANQGARTSGNVLANAGAALGALLGFAAGGGLGVEPTAFLFAFTGSIAAAMSDTCSSEIGGLYDDPRLLTTLELVEPGTDGGVTWQGEIAGLAGAAIVGLVGLAFFQFSLLGLTVILAAGAVGMTVDSLLGATVEGARLGNQGVNLLATIAAGLLAGGFAHALGL